MYHSPEPSEATPVTMGVNAIHNLTQMLLGAVVISALTIPNMVSFTSSYTQHIYLCTIGYFVLMSQAILAFSPYGWASYMKYEHKRLGHATLQILGSIMVIAGSAVRIANVNNNFNTAHGICGFIALVLAVSTLVGGLLTWIFPKMNNRVLKIAHSCVGSATLILAFVTIILAFHNWYRSALGDANANTAIVLSVFAMIGCILMAAGKNVNRLLS